MLAVEKDVCRDTVLLHSCHLRVRSHTHGEVASFFRFDVFGGVIRRGRVVLIVVLGELLFLHHDVDLQLWDGVQEHVGQ